MKNKFGILIVIFSALFSACAPQQISPERSEEIAVKTEMFTRADKLCSEKAYDEAIQVYYEYIGRFPESPGVADALMKIGAVEMMRGNYKTARAIYSRIVQEYPTSMWFQDAVVELLSALFQEGKYHDLIIKASGIQTDNFSAIHLARIYSFVGDSYMATGSPEEATLSYIKAHNIATGKDREEIVEKLNKAAAYLEPGNIISLLKTLKDRMYIGKFIFLLALNKKEEQKYDEAMEILSEFIEKFPEHENIPGALKLRESLLKNAAFEPFTLGCLLPLSGPYKVYGNRALRGIELAFSQYHIPGIGNPIRIVIEDTGSDDSRAIQGVKNLYEKKVAAIIGPIITAEPAAVEAQRLGIPIITLSQKEHIVDIGDYIFRNFITPGMQVHAVVDYTVKQLGLRRFAILYPNERYGETFMNLFWDEVLKYDGRIVGVESYSPDQTDFADPIKKIVGLFYEVPEDLKPLDDFMKVEDGFFYWPKDVGVFYNIDSNSPWISSEETDSELAGIEETDIEPEAAEEQAEDEEEPIVDFEAVFIPDAPQKAGLILPQLAYHDIENVYLLGTNLWHSENLIAMTRRHVQGALMPDGFFAENGSENVTRFVKSFMAVFNEKPEFIEAVSYDTAIMLFEILSEISSPFRISVRNRLVGLTDFKGVTGPASFGENGEIKKDLYLLRVKGKKFVQLPLFRPADN